MVSCPTLVMRSLVITEDSVIMEIARIEALTLLSILQIALDMKFGAIIKIELEQCMRNIRRMVIALWIEDPISFMTTHGDNLLVPQDPSVWLPKCDEDVEANEGISLTTMSMEYCILNDNM